MTTRNRLPYTPPSALRALLIAGATVLGFTVLFVLSILAGRQ